MSRLWVRLIKHHRIAAQQTVPCPWGEQEDALREVCRTMDVPTPLWFGKNETEFDKFRRTAFTADNFMEKLHFDRMEVEFIDDTDGSKRSADPRNDFG